MNSLEGKYLLFILLLLVVFLAFFQLGKTPLHEWDESRTGINAIEMLRNGDWVNLHFAGEPDQIRAKPPLLIWLVAASFHMFGFSEFSLRLPSAIATVFIFFFIFRITQLYKSPIFAFAVCLILLSTRGIIGYHVGRTGDFDALLLAFLLAGMYYFLQFLDFQKPKAIYWTGLLWGLAFMTKGPAMAILFPGLFLYVCFRQKIFNLLSNPSFWVGISICLVFPISWYLLIQQYGAIMDQSSVHGENVVERMFFYDLWSRFTENHFEGKYEYSDGLFIFKTMIKSFEYWNYLFYLICIGGLAYWVTRFQKVWNNSENHLLWLSIFIWLPIATFLSIATATKIWYLAPALPFVAITIVYTFEWLHQQTRLAPILFAFYFFFALLMRFFGPLPEDGPNEIPPIVEKAAPYLQKNLKMIVLGELPPQRVLLKLYFHSSEIQFIENIDEVQSLKDAHLLFTKHQNFSDEKRYTLLAADQYFVLAKSETTYWLYPDASSLTQVPSLQLLK